MKLQIVKHNNLFKILRKRSFNLFWIWKINTSRFIHYLEIKKMNYNDPITGNDFLIEVDYLFTTEIYAKIFIKKYGNYVESNGRLLKQDKKRINETTNN